MNTSQYQSDTRRQFKRDQRTAAYRELQRRTAEQRVKLEIALRDRNEAVARLMKKLVDSGFAADEVAKLAA